MSNSKIIFMILILIAIIFLIITIFLFISYYRNSKIVKKTKYIQKNIDSEKLERMNIIIKEIKMIALKKDK
jgi:heme/copper-type cytochrome/quinol oxidase subunit 2